MQRDPRSFLWDARHSADSILRFVADATLDQYLANDMLRAAVERHFEIIGEAFNRLAKVDPAIAQEISDLPRIVAFRNILVHGYATIDDRTVWRVVREELPALHKRIETLLFALDAGADQP
jgi:uncharacterized protein with HEPN domain